MSVKENLKEVLKNPTAIGAAVGGLVGGVGAMYADWQLYQATGIQPFAMGAGISGVIVGSALGAYTGHSLGRLFR